MADQIRKKRAEIEKQIAAGGNQALKLATELQQVEALAAASKMAGLRDAKGQYTSMAKLMASADERDHKIAQDIIAAKKAEFIAEQKALDLVFIRSSLQEKYIRNVDDLKGKLNKIKAIMTDPALRKTVIATEGINLLVKGIKSLGDEYKKFRDEGQTGTQALDSTFKSLKMVVDKNHGDKKIISQEVKKGLRRIE